MSLEDGNTVVEDAPVVIDDAASTATLADQGGEQAAATDVPKTPLDAVRSAFAKDAETAKPVVADDAAPKDDAVTQQAGDDLTAGKIPDDEWKAMPAVTRQRIQQFRQHVKTLNANVAEMQPKATTYNDLTSWMQKSGISQRDFVGALEVAELLKNNPLGALQRLQPVMVQLAQLSGDILPGDLQAEVDKGTIGVEQARELVRQRNEVARLRGQQTQRTQADQERDHAQQAAGMKATLTNAIASWEAQQKKSDPDYPMKSERVWERMQSLAASSGWPNSAEGMIKLANTAKTDVEAWLSKVSPGRRSITPINGSGNVANTNAVPTTALEAVRIGLSAT